MDWLISPDVVLNLVGPVLQSQVAQFGIAFGAAAWIHSGRVKKEIASLPQSTNYREMHGGLPELNEKLKAAEKRLKAIRTDSFEISSHSTGPR